MHTELFLFTQLFSKSFSVNVFPSILGIVGRLVLDYRSHSSNAADEIKCRSSITATAMPMES